MSRSTEKKVPITLNIPLSDYNALLKQSNETGFSMPEIVRRLIKKHLNREHKNIFKETM